MATYGILQMDVKDADAFKKYAGLAAVAIEKYNVEFLVRGGEARVKEGTSRAQTTLLRFKDMQTAEEFYSSPEYQEAQKHLAVAADREFKLVDGNV